MLENPVSPNFAQRSTFWRMLANYGEQWLQIKPLAQRNPRHLLGAILTSHKWRHKTCSHREADLITLLSASKLPESTRGFRRAERAVQREWWRHPLNSHGEFRARALEPISKRKTLSSVALTFLCVCHWTRATHNALSPRRPDSFERREWKENGETVCGGGEGHGGREWWWSEMKKN